MTELLVDTHIWLWISTNPERIPTNSRERVADPATRLLLSCASVWEIAIKHAQGRLPLPASPADYLADRLERTMTEIVEITAEHAIRAAALPNHHKDPFDRMIIAQAQILSVPVVSVDAKLARYDVEVRSD